MTPIVYFDTSALAKWYLNEPGSEHVERWLHEHGPVDVSTLTVVEMRSLLARRRRAGELRAAHEMKVFGTLEEDVRQGYLRCRPLDDGATTGATNLLAQLPEHPLRAVDALHLAVARAIGATHLATADRVMAEAGEALGMTVVKF